MQLNWSYRNELMMLEKEFAELSCFFFLRWQLALMFAWHIVVYDAPPQRHTSWQVDSRTSFANGICVFWVWVIIGAMFTKREREREREWEWREENEMAWMSGLVQHLVSIMHLIWGFTSLLRMSVHLKFMEYCKNGVTTGNFKVFEVYLYIVDRKYHSFI